ncbi:hypothetical protein KC721_03765, partial [Candidatus Woesebacteria bacterium]|nr:hypothetical protein [Candidatus Woesebacteria bacterium]
SETFWPFVYVGYTAIGVYGAFLWVVEWLLKDLVPKIKSIQTWKKIVIPGAHLFFNFSFILLYLWLRKIHGPWRFKSWEELTELFLILGIFVHLLYLHTNLTNKSHAK